MEAEGAGEMVLAGGGEDGRMSEGTRSSALEEDEEADEDEADEAGGFFSNVTW